MVEYRQQVSPTDSNYVVAVVELSRAFERRGWASLASEKLRAVLSGKEVTANNVELWNELAKAEESEGRYEETADILHRVMAVRYDYHGASMRHKNLQKRIDDEKTRAKTTRSAKPVTTYQDKARYEITDKTVLDIRRRHLPAGRE